MDSHVLDYLLDPLKQKWDVKFLFYFLGYVSFVYGIYIFSSSSQKTLGFFRFFLPRKVYLHPSSIVDYKFFVVNFFAVHFFTAYFFLDSEPIARYLVNVLNSVFGLPSDFWTESIGALVLVTLTLILLADFAAFYIHFLFHKIPILWEFHKVHHSAEVLNPLTVYRMHPVDVILANVFAVTLASIANALFLYLYGDGYSAYPGIATFLFFLLGYHLRHSHIWLSYPRLLSHTLVSPAQHQIHHSCEERHWDKNFGYIFAFWDYFAGSLYYPESRETFQQGLGKQEHKEFNGPLRLYWLPFLKAFTVMKSFNKLELTRSLVVILVLIFAWSWAKTLQSKVHFHLADSVYMEDLTWTEVETKLSQGVHSVIIPIGCTEQGGPHLVLGKHNDIVRYTAGEIAKKMGETIVAPVIPFSPSGEISPPTTHMKFSGTISVPEEVLGSLLEAVIESLKTHGFQKIYLIGDDFGSQDVQQVVANKLNESWAGENIIVVNLDGYYWRNQQTDWLQAEGYTMEEIGMHAGIRDTSELMAVQPKGVREERLYLYRNFTKNGTTGNSRKATEEIGQKMLQLKIKAAINQINRAK